MPKKRHDMESKMDPGDGGRKVSSRTRPLDAKVQLPNIRYPIKPISDNEIESEEQEHLRR